MWGYSSAWRTISAIPAHAAGSTTQSFRLATPPRPLMIWDQSFADDPDSMLSSDQCVIKGQHYFIKGLIEIPVIGREDTFSWGV